MARFVIGVDEAGRAPLAGPVAVGLVLAPAGFDIQKEFPGVADSKKLSPQVREEIYAMIESRAALGDIKFCARFSSHNYIDKFGMTRAVERAIASALRRLEVSHKEVEVLLDGLLKAPHHFAQQTIIGGDDRVPIISLASIVAKVRRDRLMRRMALEYPQYGFEQHKGYPTKSHYAAIEEFGLCKIHRKRYCASFDETTESAV